MARANGTDPNIPQDARAYFERHGAFPANRHDLGYVAFLMATVWNRFEAGQKGGPPCRFPRPSGRRQGSNTSSHCRGSNTSRRRRGSNTSSHCSKRVAEDVVGAQVLIGRGLATIDQMSRGGSTALANLWTHLPEPPWGIVERQARAFLAPYTPLIPPVLIASSVAYLKDLDAMGERLGHVRVTGASSGAAPPQPSRPAAPPHAQAAAAAPQNRRGRGRGADGAADG